MENIKTLKTGATKKCVNHCPQCGARIDDEHVVVGRSEFDEFPHQEFTCLDCGCVFEEIYKYSSSQKKGQNTVD
jgi:hypothetical protein